MSDKVRINNHETPVLQDLASKVPERGLIVEIGAAWGYSASKMAEVAQAGVLIVTIDPWTLSKNKQQPAREKLFHETIAPYKNRILPIKAFSQDVDREKLFEETLKGKRIDLLFIDGDHSFEGCSRDYELFGDYVKAGGLLIFHDYTYWAGVDKTVNEIVIPSKKWEGYTSHRFWIGKRL